MENSNTSSVIGNPTNVSARERRRLENLQQTYAEYKEAFDDVFGDPFATPEPREGRYNLLRGRSSIMATKNNFDEGKGTSNPARPNLIDFFCDVEKTVQTVITTRKELHIFEFTYILENINDSFTPQRRMELELAIGKLLRDRRISPVSRYFTTVRQPSVGSTKERNSRNAS